MKAKIKSRILCDLEACTQDMNSNSIVDPEPVALVKCGKVVNKGKVVFEKTNCNRLNQEKM